MARGAREQVAGGHFHLYSRGVRKEALFRDTDDRHYFLNLVGFVAARQGWIVLAYCLMDSHFHLLVQTPEANLSSGMQRLLGAYAQWFNERHALQGHVFESRFQSVLVERDAHLLELLRYIVLNPVRAGIHAHPAQSRWSSYRPTVGLGRVPRFLARDRVLELFDGPDGAALEHYDRFIVGSPDAPHD